MIEWVLLHPVLTVDFKIVQLNGRIFKIWGRVAQNWRLHELVVSRDFYPPHAAQLLSPRCDVLIEVEVRAEDVRDDLHLLGLLAGHFLLRLLLLDWRRATLLRLLRLLLLDWRRKHPS